MAEPTGCAQRTGVRGGCQRCEGRCLLSGYSALLLAAGAGSRFGGRKLLATWCDKPLICTTARIALAAPVDSCVVVTGCDADLVEAALAGLTDKRLRTVRAHDWAEGLSASLRRGLVALPKGSRGVVVFLGDMPLVPPGSAARLIEALEGGAEGAEFLHEDRPAHPVAYAHSLFSELAALSGDAGGRRVLAGRSNVTCIETDSEGSIFDVDHVDDLRA